MSRLFETLDEAIYCLGAERDPTRYLEYLVLMFDVNDILIRSCERLDTAIYNYENSEKTVLDKADISATLKEYINSPLTSQFADKEELKRLAEQTKVEPGEVCDYYAKAGNEFFDTHVTTDLTGVLELKSAFTEAQSKKHKAKAALMWEIGNDVSDAGYNSYSLNTIPGFVEARAAMEDAKHTPQYEEKYRAYHALLADAVREKIPQEKVEKLDKITNDYDTAVEELSQAKQAYMEREESLFREVISGLLESSPVSHEEATEWAKNSTDFTDAALKRLAKHASYPKEKVLEDLAYLYRLLGGKIGPVLFQTNDKHYGKSRASSDGKLVINVSTNFDKRTLFHETGHIFECADKTVLKASQDFIKTRATGEPEKLSKLCNDPRYEDWEIAYPDHFMHPYIGKIYPDASEVVSMSVERLADPEKLMEVAAKDADYLKLMLGELITRRSGTQQVSDEQSQKFAEKKQKAQAIKARFAAWERCLDKVAGPDFERLLLKKDASGNSIPFEGYYLSKFEYDTCATLYFHNGTDVKRLDTEKCKDLRRYVYFLVADARGLIPTTARGPREYVFGEYAVTPPEWFDPKQGLPEIVDTSSIAKLKKDWRKEIKRVATKELEELLLEPKGLHGYRLSSFGVRKWKEDTGTWEHVYAGETTRMTLSKAREQGTRFIYFCIANDKHLFPVTLTESDIRELAHSKSEAPEWFAELKTLPEVM